MTQNECILKLKKAEKYYEEGLIEKVPDLLTDCIKSGFTETQKTEAYRLIILSAIFEGNNTKADSFMLKLLKHNPEYQINRAIDAVEYTSLYNTYQTQPMYSLGLNIGANFTTINLTNSFGTHSDYHANPNYITEVGFQFGGRATRYLFNRAELFIESNFSQIKFRYEETVYDFSKLEFTERQQNIYFPVGVIYYPFQQKIKPYVEIGATPSFLINSTFTPKRLNNNSEIKGPDIVNEIRNSLNVSLLAGAGVQYKVPRGNLALNIRYQKGLIQQTKIKNRNENQELIFNYYYIDNDFLLNNLFVSVGYIHLFYRPRKK